MRQADFGFDLKDRWDVWLFFVVGSFVFNICGEEFWWRGISSLGGVVAYLPLTVRLAFVAQRTRNTWPGIIAHFIGKIALPIGILYRVLGLPLPGGG